MTVIFIRENDLFPIVIKPKWSQQNLSSIQVFAAQTSRYYLCHIRNNQSDFLSRGNGRNLVLNAVKIFGIEHQSGVSKGTGTEINYKSTLR